MGLKLQSVTDPRDKLDKVRRKPLENFIRTYHPEIYEHNMPAEVMRHLLRLKKVYDISAPVHSLGENSQEEVPEVNATDLMMAEWEAKKKIKPSMADLRKAVKAKGIVAPRTAKKADLERMLNGEDTPQRRQ